MDKRLYSREERLRACGRASADRPPEPGVCRAVAGYPVREECFDLAGRRLRLLRPEDPDRILDEAVEWEAYQKDDFLPYWAELWPAGLVLAEYLLAHPDLLTDPVLELGCGLGLVGVAALALGRQVVFSDYEPLALEFARVNAQFNALEGFQTLRLDWRHPAARRFATIVGSDLLYERRWHGPLVDVFDAMLEAHGRVILSDPDRRFTPEFLAVCAARGYESSPVPREHLGPVGRGEKVTIYHIAKSRPADLPGRNRG